MSMLQKAIDVATEALAGKQDQYGRPYVEHALRVMEKMETEEEKIVAVLHDVLEDSEWSMGDLRIYDFSQAVLEAVVEDNQDVVRVNKMSFKTYTLEERAKKTIRLLKGE